MLDHAGQMTPRFVRPPELESRTGRSKRHLQRMASAGDFPAFHRQSHKVTVCYEDEVDAWLRWRRDEDQGRAGGKTWRDYLPTRDAAA